MNNSVSTGERNRVNSYLAIKYGITTATGNDYVSSTGATLWSRATNSGYRSNITFIGRDDNSALNQKQSKSTNESGLVTMALGAIAVNNSGNTNTFATDQSFLGFADDAATFTRVLTWTGGAPADMQRLVRTWKVSETGTDTTDLMISVPDDSSALTGKLPREVANTMYLLVDTDNDFSNGGTTIYTGTLSGSLSGAEWIFSGVDLDDSNFFTFATNVPAAPG